MIIFNNLCFSYTAEDEVAAVASLSQMLALLHSSFCYSLSHFGTYLPLIGIKMLTSYNQCISYQVSLGVGLCPFGNVTLLDFSCSLFCT